jgi:hypothetical protein
VRGLFCTYLDRTISAQLMTAYPVTPKMNKASFNEPEAIPRSTRQ